MKLDNLKVEAQSALDKLWATDQIPFELTAHKVESLGAEEYIAPMELPSAHPNLP